MSIRLNKIGNIPEAVPYTPNSAVGFTSGAYKAYIEMSSTNTVEPYYGPSTLGASFAGYSGGLIGPSGSTISYCGSGASRFRDSKGDYFLAAFNLSPLFDSERDTPALIGLKMHCNAITATTFKLASDLSYDYLVKSWRLVFIELLKVIVCFLQLLLLGFRKAFPITLLLLIRVWRFLIL